QYLCCQNRRPMRHHHDGGDEPQARGLGGDEGDLGQLLVAPGGGRACGEFAGFGIGIARIDARGYDDVVAEGGEVESHRLAADANPGERLSLCQRSRAWRVEADFHGPSGWFGSKTAAVNETFGSAAPP